MKALKITPIVTLLKPYSFMMSVAVLARLTRSRYVMRYIRQRRSSTTQRTWLRPDTSSFSISIPPSSRGNQTDRFAWTQSFTYTPRPQRQQSFFGDCHLPCECERVRISCCINPDNEHSANFIAAATQFACQARGFLHAGGRTRERIKTRGEGRG